MESLELRVLLAGDLVISEFVANNRLGLRDNDGDRPDWIEIYNSAAEAVDLGGYYLTDDARDLTKWKLPSMTLNPQAYRVVFASGKDQSDPDQALHVNFRLNTQGESLMLVDPDGKTIAFSYADYPTQYEDVSFGTPQTIRSTVVVGRDSAAKFLIPTAEDPGSNAPWT